MTDAELLKALRLQSEHVPAFTVFDEAADRIEELNAQLKMVLERETETQVRHDNKVDALEAKLADAVAALRAAVNVCQRAINGYAAKM